MRSALSLSAVVIAAATALCNAAYAADVDEKRLLNADKEPNYWMMYHGSYRSYHYSSLADINTENVKGLKEAWSHVASRSVRGLQSYPLIMEDRRGRRLDAWWLRPGDQHRVVGHRESCAAL